MDDRYACKSLCVLWTQGRPALSVQSDQMVEVAKNKAPYINRIWSDSNSAHIEDGTKTKNIASGCKKHIAHAFPICIPSVVVNIPILKHANMHIPSVM